MRSDAQSISLEDGNADKETVELDTKPELLCPRGCSKEKEKNERKFYGNESDISSSHEYNSCTYVTKLWFYLCMYVFWSCRAVASRLETRKAGTVVVHHHHV